MKNRWLNLIVTLALCAVGRAAFADPPRASHNHWRNTNYHGHYVLYDRDSNTWIETVDCRVLWRFTLVSNATNELTLFDAGRGMTVRLTYEGMWLKAAGAADFTFYQAGTFDTRTMFSHVDAGGAYTGSISKHHGCAWEEWFPGGGAPAFRFVETAADNTAVELYDGSRAISVRLDDTRMWLKHGNGAYGFFKNGSWR